MREVESTTSPLRGAKMEERKDAADRQLLRFDSGSGA
jgi:hypothetical protein